MKKACDGGCWHHLTGHQSLSLGLEMSQPFAHVSQALPPYSSWYAVISGALYLAWQFMVAGIGGPQSGGWVRHRVLDEGRQRMQEELSAQC